MRPAHPAAVVVALAALIAACAPSTTTGPSPTRPAASPTPVVVQATTGPAASPEATCAAPAQPTSAQTEGPFFKAGSPERASLLDAGLPGIRLLLTGRVVTRSCAPVSRALLDFWQADANGQYDNAGYRLRGHLFSDAQGNYRLETLVPGLYTGRTRHIHVKVQAPGHAALTSQIYFPDEQQNATDSIFRPDLLARVDSRTATAWAARFDFVLDLP